MTYHTLIRHQELVALLGTRNLQLRLVYAHIANYTQARGAWCGSRQKLADELEIERTVVSRKLEELTTRGLITVENDTYRAVCTAERAESTDERAENTDERAESTEKRAESTEKRAESTEKRAESTENRPLINNKEMKRNEKYARETLATPDPKDQCSFNRLALLYMQRVGSFQMSETVRNESRAIWENFPLWKRLLMLKELAKPTGQVRPRLDWTLSAFNPQPEFLSGPDQDEYWKSPEWVKNRKPLCKVLYQGLYKICTEETMRTFDLEFKEYVRQYVE